MKKALITRLLAGVLLALPAITIPTADATEHGTASGLHIPAPGSAERKAILDTLRKQGRWVGGPDTVFVVTYLKVNKGWAWLSVLPESSDGLNHYENDGALMHKVGGKWVAMPDGTGDGECAATDSCPSDAAIFRRLKSKYPSLPSNIFPNG